MNERARKSRTDAGPERYRRPSARTARLDARRSEDGSPVGAGSACRLIVETIKESAFAASVDGRIGICNARFGELLGRPIEEVAGHGLWEFVARHDVEAARTLLDGGREQPTRRRLVFQTADGAMVAAHVSATVLLEPGHPRLCVVAREPWERERSTEVVEQQLFEAGQRLQALMNALPVGVSFSNDVTCRAVTGNPAVLAQLDAKTGDNLSASASDEHARGRQVRYFREGRQLTDNELPLQRAVAENREIPPVELEVVMPSGRRWWADASGAPIRDGRGEVVGGVAVTVDVTRRKKAEEALRLANATLERRVQERAAEAVHRVTQLRALACQVTLSEQRERRRLARVLHDHLQQLLAGAKFRAAVLGREAEPRVKQAVAEIEDLLDAALDASRSLTAELNPPILQEGGLSVGLAWLARWMEERHGLTVDLSAQEGLPPLADDVKVLLFESVRELLFNTVKYSHVRRAAVDFRQVEGGDLRIVVSDTGGGFDPAKLRRAGEAGGGFGLFSIRERLGLVGGHLEIDSAPGQGSRFTLGVPLGQATVAERPAVAGDANGGPTVPAHPTTLGTPVRVLLADDHAATREGLRRLLGQQTGIEVVGEAADGEAAVEMAGRLQPDVVVMDVAMPKVDGVAATRAIHRRHPEIRVIGLSMFEESEQAQGMRQAGAATYLPKSGRLADLIAAILAGPGGAAERQPTPAPRR